VGKKEQGEAKPGEFLKGLKKDINRLKVVSGIIFTEKGHSRNNAMTSSRTNTI